MRLPLWAAIITQYNFCIAKHTLDFAEFLVNRYFNDTATFRGIDVGEAPSSGALPVC